jgi:eukaryotic-like serine/threonine-protein kinase
MLSEREVLALLAELGVPPDVVARVSAGLAHTTSTEGDRTTEPATTRAPVAPHEASTTSASEQSTAPATSGSGLDETAQVFAANEAEARYIDLGQIGRGGMGEVRRVRDRRLNRVLAMKAMRADVSAAGRFRRFFEEAQVTAQLQHPSIIPVHDVGKLADGRLYFTMKEVQGRTLREIIREIHRASAQPIDETDAGAGSDGGWRPGPSGWTFRRMVDAFQRVAEGLAYAHARGVLHRDVKPQNIMVGEYGEVLLLDWGLTRSGGGSSGDAGAEGGGDTITRAGGHTRFGTVAGTIGYMSPEQASGDPARVGPPSDVYALGATLYHLLAGHLPRGTEGAESELDLLFKIPPLPERVGNKPDGAVIPAELGDLCARAMAPEPDDRPTAAVLAAEIAQWLDGAQRRAQATKVVAEAASLKPRIAEFRARAAALREEAAAMLDQLSPIAPVEQKQPIWRVQDAARDADQQAELLLIRVTQLLRGALTHASDFDAAHAMLADLYQEQHAAAERRRDPIGAARAEAFLREHDRGAWAAYLEGDGLLDLVTDPPGATLTLYRYHEENRILRLEPVADLGVSPIANAPIALGSYLVRISLDGHHDVNYPVQIERQHHWTGRRTGSDVAVPIYLPKLGELGPEDCYVPAGWFWSGGDPGSENSLPGRRLWLDGFVIRRFPVTFEEYLAFLNDLADRGRGDEALTYAPPTPAWEESHGAAGEHGIDRMADGRFAFSGPQSRLRWPVTMINWDSAAAYAAWLAEHEHRPWRLVAEMEHEKAFRGVDGRPYPWGNTSDPTFCKMRYSLTGDFRVLKATVDEFPIDESPYGVRGLSGNTHTWCVDVFQPKGPVVIDDVPQVNDGSDGEAHGVAAAHRAIRGGSFRDAESKLRGAYRDSPPASYRDTVLGLRVARPFGV